MLKVNCNHNFFVLIHDFEGDQGIIFCIVRLFITLLLFIIQLDLCPACFLFKGARGDEYPYLYPIISSTFEPIDISDNLLR